jgi:hypothetical protein
MHAPFEHRWPCEHAGPSPQRHCPSTAEHESERCGSQAMQALPGAPHVATEGAVQVDPLQQPSGHEAVSQTQEPATQRWPAPHDGPLPQRHSPAPEQPSARTGSQATHTEPAVPQVAADARLHVGPEQQPFGQLCALQLSQAPPTQRLAPQSWQLAPPAPQASSAVPATQRPCAQQPEGQLCASHRQVPPTQRWPSAHAGPAPQVQAPLAEHPSAVASQAKHP